MKLIKFTKDDGEVLINLERVSHIKKELISDRTVVYVISGGSEWIEFAGVDAGNVWDYFSKTVGT